MSNICENRKQKFSRYNDEHQVLDRARIIAKCLKTPESLAAFTLAIGRDVRPTENRPIQRRMKRRKYDA